MDSPIVAALRAAGCVFAEDEARLLTEAAASPAELDDLLARRVAGEPLETLLGWAEFAGLRIAVEPGVFVPRRRTEFLAHQAAALAHKAALTAPDAVVVDLCCGSGVIGAAIRAAVGGIELYAADVDPVAVRCARRNLGADRVFAGDLYDPLPPALRGRVNVLVANVPYVPTRAIATMPPEARDHEPPVALDGGSDGLDVARRFIAGAPGWLAPGGHLLFETSEAQAAEATHAIAAIGLDATVAYSEEWSATVVIGRN
jgi:release factor glutamine methyltransferase